MFNIQEGFDEKMFSMYIVHMLHTRSDCYMPAILFKFVFRN